MLLCTNRKDSPEELENGGHHGAESIGGQLSPQYKVTERQSSQMFKLKILTPESYHSNWNGTNWCIRISKSKNQADWDGNNALWLQKVSYAAGTYILFFKPYNSLKVGIGIF